MKNFPVSHPQVTPSLIYLLAVSREIDCDKVVAGLLAGKAVCCPVGALLSTLAHHRFIKHFTSVEMDCDEVVAGLLAG
jgi:hypothetical protein